MKKHFFPAVIVFICFLVLLNSSFTPAQKAPALQYYQLTIYHTKNAGQLAVINDYLKNVYLPVLHKNGLADIGVFNAHGNDTATDKKLFVLIPFASLQKFESLMKTLSDGTLIKNDTSAYTNAAFNNPPYERIETMLLKAFKDMPVLKKPASEGPYPERVYELRSYEAATEKLYRQKVYMFNEGGEVTLFDRLQFNAVFYAEVLAGSHMPNLMYMTTFKNMAERDDHWKEFGSDSTWKRISALPEFQNTVSKSDIYFLYPADYSDY